MTGAPGGGDDVISLLQEGLDQTTADALCCSSNDRCFFVWHLARRNFSPSLGTSSALGPASRLRDTIGPRVMILQDSPATWSEQMDAQGTRSSRPQRLRIRYAGPIFFQGRPSNTSLLVAYATRVNKPRLTLLEAGIGLSSLRNKPARDGRLSSCSLQRRARINPLPEM